MESFSQIRLHPAKWQAIEGGRAQNFRIFSIFDGSDLLHQRVFSIYFCGLIKFNPLSVRQYQTFPILRVLSFFDHFSSTRYRVLLTRVFFKLVIFHSHVRAYCFFNCFQLF